jgi:antitoxin component of RelBE/YafQ-DinJ toxin-antitoxin module
MWLVVIHCITMNKELRTETLNVRLPRKAKSRLVSIARRNGLDVSDVVRLALEKEVTRWERGEFDLLTVKGN